MHFFKNLKTTLSSFAVIATIVLFTSSCEELKDKTIQTVEVNPEPVDFVIDSSSFNAQKAANETVIVLDTMISIDVAGVLEENGFSIDNLSNGTLIEAELSTQFPEDAFSFMNGATLKIGNESQEPAVVAQVTNVNPESNSVMLETFDENLMQYIEQDPLHIILEIDANGPLPTNMMELSLDNIYEVEVEVL